MTKAAALKKSTLISSRQINWVLITIQESLFQMLQLLMAKDLSGGMTSLKAKKLKIFTAKSKSQQYKQESTVP